MTADEFHRAGRPPDPEEFWVDWTFRILPGPGTAVVATPIWGDRVAFDAAAPAPSPDEKRGVAMLVGRQFVQTLCRELGLADAKVTLKVEE